MGICAQDVVVASMILVGIIYAKSRNKPMASPKQSSKNGHTAVFTARQNPIPVTSGPLAPKNGGIHFRHQSIHRTRRFASCSASSLPGAKPGPGNCLRKATMTFFSSSEFWPKRSRTAAYMNSQTVKEKTSKPAIS
jgi:hypothetical protein